LCCLTKCNLAAKVSYQTQIIMKNVMLCFAFLIFAGGLSAQNQVTESPAQEAVEKLVQQYNLDKGQAAEMLKVQERKYRNLAEIEPLQATDPQLFTKKVRALQYANDKSFERILTKEQIPVHHQQQIELREKKALAFKELKTAGASQQEIENKMLVLDLESLQ